MARVVVLQRNKEAYPRSAPPRNGSTSATTSSGRIAQIGATASIAHSAPKTPSIRTRRRTRSGALATMSCAAAVPMSCATSAKGRHQSVSVVPSLATSSSTSWRCASKSELG